jgi:DNA-binding MarR family transcriptional regulator
MTARDTRRALHRYGLARDRFTAAVGQATNLTSTEVEALEHLEEEGPLTQKQLADRLFLTSGGTTLLVDRLERDGFVSRRRHPSDRRAVLVELNQAPAPQTAPALERYHAAVMAAARNLSAAERESVARFLDAASAAAGEAAEELRTDDQRRRHERRGRSGARASRQGSEVDHP